MLGCQRQYVEDFNTGPGGWSAWRRHGENVPLRLRDGVAYFSSPWGVDSNHAPPGAGYLSLLAFLYTVGGRGPADAGPNRFVEGGFSRDLTNATLTLRLCGDVRLRGADLTVLIQAHVDSVSANFILVGQSFPITSDWREATVTLEPDPSQWLCIGSRHDMRHHYGYGDVVTALRDVDIDLILVLYPLTIVPAEPRDDLHRLRPDHDYAIDRRYLPEGEIALDAIALRYPPA